MFPYPDMDTFIGSGGHMFWATIEHRIQARGILGNSLSASCWLRCWFIGHRGVKCPFFRPCPLSTSSRDRYKKANRSQRGSLDHGVQCCSEASYPADGWMESMREGARLPGSRRREAQRCRLSLSPGLGCPVALPLSHPAGHDSSFPGKTSHKWVERGGVWKDGLAMLTAALRPSGSGGVRVGWSLSQTAVLTWRQTLGQDALPITSSWNVALVPTCFVTYVLCTAEGEAQAGSLQSNIKLSGKLKV